MARSSPPRAQARSAAAGPCLCLQLRRAARIVTQAYDDEMRLIGMSLAQFGLLHRLAALGEPTQRRLAGELNLDTTTLTRTLAPLVARGLITKEQRGPDRRERRLQVTPRGRERIRAGGRNWRQAQERMRRALGERGFEQLHALLEQVVATAPTDE